MTFHVKCLLWNQFAWNFKPIFWRKIFQNFKCFKFYPACPVSHNTSHYNFDCTGPVWFCWSKYSSTQPRLAPQELPRPYFISLVSYYIYSKYLDTFRVSLRGSWRTKWLSWRFFWLPKIHFCGITLPILHWVVRPPQQITILVLTFEQLIQFTQQPLYNTVVGVHSINHVS